jgi:hypothetical protein
MGDWSSSPGKGSRVSVCHYIQTDRHRVQWVLGTWRSPLTCICCQGGVVLRQGVILPLPKRPCKDEIKSAVIKGTLRYSLHTYLLTHLLTYFTYLLTPWCRIFEKLTATQLVKNIPHCYGTRRFITVFTKACHRTLSRVRRIQFASSIPVSLRSILMLSSHLRRIRLFQRISSGPRRFETFR